MDATQDQTDGSPDLRAEVESIDDGKCPVWAGAEHVAKVVKLFDGVSGDRGATSLNLLIATTDLVDEGMLEEDLGEELWAEYRAISDAE